MEPAWKDADDERIQVDLAASDRLKKFIAGSSVVSGKEYEEKLRGFYSAMHQPSWTQASEVVDRKSLTGLLATSKAILAVKTHRLLDGRIDISQLPHLNLENPSKSAIAAVSIRSNLALTGGFDKKLRLFRLGEVTSPCQSVAFFRDLPIQSARFLSESVYVSGKRPFYYVFDMGKETIRRVPVLLGYEKCRLERMNTAPDGRFVVFMTEGGSVPFVSTMSQKVAFQVKMNADCLCSTFLSENDFLTAGADGDIYEWDLRTRRCVRRFPDVGNACTTTIAATSQLIATGSPSGVVNIYDQSSEDFHSERPQPKKSLLNLTTSVDGLEFSSSGELLAMWSKWKRGGVRLAHCQSLSVYSNWPEARGAVVQFPHSVCFSEDNKYLAVGNDEGTALLYKLNHYAGD